MSAHLNPLLHNKNSFQYTVICLKALLPPFFPQFLTAPKKMHEMLYISLYKGHKWNIVELDSPPPPQKHIIKKKAAKDNVEWFSHFIRPDSFKLLFSNLGLLFRTDILLSLKQLPFLVKRSSTLLFLTELPFHYFAFFLCLVSSAWLKGRPVFPLSLSFNDIC